MTDQERAVVLIALAERAERVGRNAGRKVVGLNLNAELEMIARLMAKFSHPTALLDEIDWKQTFYEGLRPEMAGQP